MIHDSCFESRYNAKRKKYFINTTKNIYPLLFELGLSSSKQNHKSRGTLKALLFPISDVNSQKNLGMIFTSCDQENTLDPIVPIRWLVAEETFALILSVETWN